MHINETMPQHHHHHKPHHVFSWWIGYILLTFLRKYFQNPDRLLGPHLKQGMSVLEIGPGMGFFSILIAHAVGEGGQIYCIDNEDKMLQTLRKRALNAGVEKRLHARLSTTRSFGTEELIDKIDFALVFWVAHEVSDSGLLWKEVVAALKKGGTLLFSEPKNAVSENEFNNAVIDAERSGLKTISRSAIWGSHSVVLQKI